MIEALKIPQHVQDKLNGFGELRPDMDVFFEDSKEARVVFDPCNGGVKAYLRFGERGQEVPTMIITRRNHEAAIAAAVDFIFLGQTTPVRRRNGKK